MTSGGVPVLTRARCVFEADGSGMSSRFDDVRRRFLAECGAKAAVCAGPSGQPEDHAGPGGQPEDHAGPGGQPEERPEPSVTAYVHMRGGMNDVEQAARYLQLAHAGNGLDDPAPTAAAVFETAGDEPLAEAANTWRDLQGVMRLVGEEGFDAAAAGPKVKSLVSGACGQEDFDALASVVEETASRAAARIDTLAARS